MKIVLDKMSDDDVDICLGKCIQVVAREFDINDREVRKAVN